MIEEIKYFLLGLIQGLAEFFPISSSGHIVIFSSLLDIVEEHPLLLSITVHFATTISTIIVYFNRIKSLIKGVFINNIQTDISYFLKIIFSSVPVVLIGFLFKEHIELVFSDFIYLVSIMLLITGFILLSTNLFSSEEKNITYYHALLMGLAQAFALLPGISRSGVTISMALLCKIKRKKAAEFSFLMVLLPIIGITFLELMTLYYSDITLNLNQITGLLIAFFTSLFSGLFACRYMIHIVQMDSLKYFGYYCIFAGLVSYFLIF